MYFDDKQIYRILKKLGISIRKIREAIDALDFKLPVIKPKMTLGNILTRGLDQLLQVSLNKQC